MGSKPGHLTIRGSFHCQRFLFPVAYLHASQKPDAQSPHRDRELIPTQALRLVRQPHLWGLGLGSFALGLVNGAFVISMGVGWVAYKQLQSLSPSQWTTLRRQIEQALPLPRTIQQQALVLSLLLAASTYTMTSLWQATHSLLMGSILLGQTSLTFFVVGLILRAGKSTTKVPQFAAEQPPLRRSNPDSPQTVTTTARAVDPLEQSLNQLTHSDPLQRLVAIRRLVKLVDDAEVEQLYAVSAQVTLRSHLLDCFHLMLAHESEPIVRTAVREGLDLLRQTHQLPAGPPPLPTANPLQSVEDSPSQVDAPSSNHQRYNHQRHRTVEYIEYLEP